MTQLRTQLLATTMLASLGITISPADAQQAPAAASAQPNAAPIGPIEALPQPTLPAQGQPAKQPQEIVITGSRIPQPNLHSAAPVTVVSDQDIKLQGTSRIEDVLNSLPSVGASQNAFQSNAATGTAEVDLRYLGAKRTLTLVNGRRLMPGDPNTPREAADLNIIPASLVRRVEVLTGGASSVYGADAVAGVVNFIVDTNFTGIRFDGQTSVFQHNNQDFQVTNGATMSQILAAKGYQGPIGNSVNGGSFDGTVSLGAAFDNGRGHAVAYLGYRKVDPVLQSSRNYSDCTIQNTSGGAPRCGGSATADPGDAVVFAPTSHGAITSTVAALGPGTIAPFSSNVYNFAPLNYYQRPDERYVAGAFADYEIDRAAKPYLEFMFMDDRTVAQLAPSGDFGQTLTVNCNNPLMSAAQQAVICSPENTINGFIGSFPTAAGASYNPNPSNPPLTFIDPTTGQPYTRGFFQLLRRNAEGGPRINDLKHISYRGVLGMRGELSDAWSYDAYYQYGKTNYTQIFQNELSASRLARALDVVTDSRAGSATFGQPVCRSVLDGSDTACVPWDVFGAAGPSQAAENYINVYGVIDGATLEQIANVNFTGNLGEMGIKTPWASDGFGINLGGEYRKESLELKPDEEFQTGDLTGQGGATVPVSGSFRVLEVFAEGQFPIVQHGFVDDLSLSAGYRRSYYRTGVGRTFNTSTYKLSLEFAPVRDVRFRGAYNRAVRAPNIQELFAPPVVANSGTKDPCAGHTILPTEYGCIATGLTPGRTTPPNPAGQYNGLIGGNPDLTPEKATTITAGIVLQPRFVPRLALTVDYFDIKLVDAIQGFGSDAIVTACKLDSTSPSNISPACALIHRDPSGSLWLTPGGQAGAGFVVDTPTNVGRIHTSGIDVNASYSYPIAGLGRLNASLIGTYTRKYMVNNGLTAPYDCAGLFGPVCTSGSVASSAPIPKWRHKLRTTLEMRNGLGVSLQWRYVGKVRAETLESNPTLVGAYNFDPGLRIPGQNYFDLAATARFGNHYNLRLGVNNVLDRRPPVVTSGNGNRDGSNLCPGLTCNGNTFPGTWDPLGRFVYAGLTLNF